MNKRTFAIAVIFSFLFSTSYGSYVLGPNWLGTASTFSSLPVTGNSSGDARVSVNDGGVYLYNGSTWVLTNASATAANITGIVPVVNGGSGQGSALTPYGEIYAASATKMASAPTGPTGWPLVEALNSAPTFQVLSVLGGGSGQSAALTPYGNIYSASATAMGSTGTGPTGWPLVGALNAAPTFQQLNLASAATGILSTYALPTPTTVTLGGIDSVASQAHKWLSSISNSGVPAETQPAFTDISGTATTTQGGTGSPTTFNFGSIVWAGTAGIYSADTALYWSPTGHQLGISTETPQAGVDVHLGSIISDEVVTSSQCVNFSQGNTQTDTYSSTNTIKLGGMVGGGAYAVALTGYTAGQTVTVLGYTDQACTVPLQTGVDFSGTTASITNTFTAAGNTQVLSFVYFVNRGVLYGSPNTNYFH